MHSRKRRNSSSAPSASPSPSPSPSSPSSPRASKRPCTARLPSAGPVLEITDSDLEYEPKVGNEGRGAGEGRRVNPLYGQRAAFPGLEMDDEGDGDGGRRRVDWTGGYAGANTGIEYLKFVRSEAKGVPHVLVRPQASQVSESAKDQVYADGYGDGGYFEDGAFIAAPNPTTSNLNAARDSAPDAQEVYYMSMKSRLQTINQNLQQAPPLPALEALTSDHPISFPPESTKAKQQWRFLLQSQQPRMAQLACMDMKTVLEVVKLLKGLLAATIRSGSREKIERLGAWIWGVLGRCDEAGQLDSDEVSELRELGKRAVGLLVGIRDRSGKAYGHQEEVYGHQEEDEENEEETSQANPAEAPELRPEAIISTSDGTETGDRQGAQLDFVELEAAKVRLQNGLHSEDQTSVNKGTSVEEGEVEEEGDEDDGNEQVEVSVDQHVRVLLDMVITVVGDCYGQRDLLDFRDIWGEDEAAG